jgi:hypothetical protein
VLFVPETNAINDVNPSAKVVVLFPNPAENRLHVKVDNGNGIVYRILDIVGKQIISGTLNRNGEINVSSLDCGVYLFQLENAKTLRFVISRK